MSGPADVSSICISCIFISAFFSALKRLCSSLCASISSPSISPSSTSFPASCIPRSCSLAIASSSVNSCSIAINFSSSSLQYFCLRKFFPTLHSILPNHPQNWAIASFLSSCCWWAISASTCASTLNNPWRSATVPSSPSLPSVSWSSSSWSLPTLARAWSRALTSPLCSCFGAVDGRYFSRDSKLNAGTARLRPRLDRRRNTTRHFIMIDFFFFFFFFLQWRTDWSFTHSTSRWVAALDLVCLQVQILGTLFSYIESW